MSRSDNIVTSIRFTPAGAAHRRSGLLGWVGCIVGGFRLDGLAVRRLSNGQLSLTYPERRDGRGKNHTLVLPVDREARRAIEREILGAIDIDGGGQR